MKKIFIIAFVLVALCAQGATKVKTQHFEVSDSVIFLEKDDPQALGYKMRMAVSADWPVSINGKESSALTKLLLDSVFYASSNRDIIPYYTSNVSVLRDFIGDWVYRSLRSHNMAQEYDVKECGSAPSIDCEENPMNCWYETTELMLSHVVDNLVFFKEYNDCYFGGAHNMFFTGYYAFDAALEKHITLKDIVTSPKKLLRMLPAYDKRDKDVKWWENITTESIENFYVKNGKLVFVFAPYAIGPFCDGEIEVAVPLKTLRAKGLLTAYGKKLKVGSKN